MIAQKNKYPLLLRMLHWVMALLMIGLLIAGFVMAELLQPPFKFTVYNVHKTLGLTVFGLALVRIALRLTADKVPPLPERIKWYERFMAKLVYLSFYILMIAFPLSGYIMSSAGGYPIYWFGIEVPLLIGKNPEIGHLAKEIHEFFGYTLIALISLHFIGFLKHFFCDKENLLKRMW